MRVSLVGIVGLCLAIACAREPDRSESSRGHSEPAARGQNHPDSVLLEFEQTALKLGRSRAALVRSLGKPTSVHVQEAENGNGDRDSLITVRYPGLEFLLRKPKGDSAEYFSNVTVSDSSLALPAGIRVLRSTHSDVIRVLGQAHRINQFADTAALTYDVPKGPVVQFYFVGTLLLKLRWIYELG